MQIGSELKKLKKMDDLSQKQSFETVAARTFTLANAIFAS